MHPHRTHISPRHGSTPLASRVGPHQRLEARQQRLQRVHRVCTDGSHGGRSPGRSWQLLLLSSCRTPQGRWPATSSSARRPRPPSSASAIAPAARRREAPPTHTVKHKDHGSWAAIVGCEARACCAGHGRMQRSKAACVRRAPGSILALLASSPATPPPATVCFSTSPPDCEQLLTSGLQ